jgi:predicted acylesterase/phospholipase RssA
VANNPADFRSLAEEDLLSWAVRILEGEQTPQNTVFQIARVLKNRWKRFGMARKLLWLARSDSGRVTERRTDSPWMRKLAQQHALCTYKDQDLPAYVRFDRALAILRTEDLRDFLDSGAVITQETLGIAGAIAKARWEAFGQRSYLDQSLAFYDRGWSQGAGDDGYTGINTAYVLDLIAFQKETDARAMGTVSAEAAQMRERAREIRTTLTAAGAIPAIADAVTRRIAEEPAGTSDEAQDRVDRLYWLLVTLGEAHVGLGLEEGGNLASARAFYARARELDRSDWMVESTATQLSSLFRLRRGGRMTASGGEKQVMESLVGNGAAGVEGALAGKIGLALSGGGFRASLFHIGVLARLAELDMLRHVEYLSCVSGGSIIGAYYYLEVRKLLESKTDEELGRDDYVTAVKNIEVQFLAGVQQNLRMQAIRDPAVNRSYEILSGALPTERVAELYESMLFAKVDDHAGASPRYLNNLEIHPKDWPGARFRPKEDNWRRRHKAPILVLNATTLNTGHNWQFTAAWMGEPPSTVNNEADCNQRLRRMYYGEAPPEYRQVRLGRAVGASACVPALFVPLEFPRLYGDMTVRLVDGGVHDNQGVSSLVEQGCTVLLVSDASGQLADQGNPTERIASTAARADEIAQERVRVAQFSDLESRRRSGLLRTLMFLHLKRDLEMDPKDWIGCPLPYDAGDEARPAGEKGPLTSYGINRDLQRRIAAIRTDLDAFHDVEAFALMVSGYRMTEFHFPPELQWLAAPPLEKPPWGFLSMAGEMAKSAPQPELLSLLDRSAQRILFAHGFEGRVKAAAVALVLVLLAAGWFRPGYVLGALLALVLVVAFRFRWLARGLIAPLMARSAREYLRSENQVYLDKGRWPISR